MGRDGFHGLRAAQKRQTAEIRTKLRQNVVTCREKRAKNESNTSPTCRSRCIRRSFRMCVPQKPLIKRNSLASADSTASFKSMYTAVPAQHQRTNKTQHQHKLRTPALLQTSTFRPTIMRNRIWKTNNTEPTASVTPSQHTSTEHRTNRVRDTTINKILEQTARV